MPNSQNKTKQEKNSKHLDIRQKLRTRPRESTGDVWSYRGTSGKH